MKKVLFLSLFIFLSISVFAQVEKEAGASKSEAVAFSSRDGALIKKEFYNLGKVKGIDFSVLVLTDILKNEKIACLRIITTYFSSASRSSDEYIGTLDSDEIDACIKSLIYIKDNLLSIVPTTYTECEYKSKDGVKMGAFNDSKEFGKWSSYVQTKSYTSRSAVFLKGEDIDSFIVKLTEAKQKINELK